MNFFQTHYSTLLLLFAFSIISACGTQTAADIFYEQPSNKKLDDIVQDVEFIVTEYNFRITTRLHIGDAIKDRGSSNFPRNEVILFCNLTLAEKMLLIEPAYVNYCPYQIAVADVGKKNVISARLLPENTGKTKLDGIAKKINKTLKSMVEYAASNDPFSVQPLNENPVKNDE